MEVTTTTSYLTCSILFLQISLIQCLNNHVFHDSLDSILYDRAFREMIHRRPRTDVLYNATLLANLAGMKVSVIGLRSTTLWRNGANFSDIVFPPGTLAVPHVKRLLIVYHNLNNWSALYYSLPGYTLASPVVGFLAYDATHLISSKKLSESEVELNTMGKPIYIKFHDSLMFNTVGNQKTTKCACFGASGRVEISEMRLPQVCYSRSQGHFSVVIPVKKKHKIWPFWIMGFLAGLVGLILVGLAGAVAVGSFIGKRTHEMEKEADEGECLQTYWIASSKMPLAQVTRTQPVLRPHLCQILNCLGMLSLM